MTQMFELFWQRGRRRVVGGLQYLFYCVQKLWICQHDDTDKNALQNLAAGRLAETAACGRPLTSTRFGGIVGFSARLRSVAACAHTHTQRCVKSGRVVWSGVHLISTCWPDRFTALTQWAAELGAYNKQAWEQTWNTRLRQQTNCPPDERVWDQQAEDDNPLKPPSSPSVSL